MQLVILTFTFYLPGCESLKEKRGRLRGMKDKFGREANIAISESGAHDSHQSAEWSFVVFCRDKLVAEKILSQIELYASTQIDAVITGVNKNWL